MRRLFYLVREAWTNMRINRTTTIVAVLTTAFTLACVGIFLLVYVNLRHAAGSLQEDVKIMVYLEDRFPSVKVQELEQKLKADRMVGGVLFISKEQALGEFQVQFPGESHLLEGLGENPLPASFVVTLAPNFRSPDAMKSWVERVQTMEGVAKVDYNQEWLSLLAELIGYIELTAIGVGFLLSAAAVTIIGNTIRLALLARREEIEILRSIGATRTFIRIPYFLEGAVLGACGSALSLGILKFAFELFRQQIQLTGRFSGIENMMSFFPLSVCLALVMAGMGLGFAGSVVSILRIGERRA
ncbi:MAG TPA: permease-like cell division protein FtsX [Nitrospira sp.]|jgi:cell division transport system permease protein|nr:permease-like cell division protein FtsX [Nitrospira sp.]